MEIGDHSLHDVIAVSRCNDNLGGSYQSVHIPAVEIFDDVAERLSRVYFFTSVVWLPLPHGERFR